eukprot:11286616-Prorocentrum_lima.AAC.1
MGRALSAGVKWICMRTDWPGWEEAEDTDAWGPDDWAPAQENSRPQAGWLRCAKRGRGKNPNAGKLRVWRAKAPGWSR